MVAGLGAPEDQAIELLTGSMRTRRDDAAAFARRYRVVLVAASNGVPVDVSVGALPFELDLVKRATPFDFGDGRPLPTCSAEDRVVLKAFAGRPQDWIDIEGVAAKQGSRLDWPSIEKRPKPFAEVKEDPAMFAQLDGIRRRAATP